MRYIPLLDLKSQYATIRSEIRQAIDRVCDSQQFILGPEVTALEEAVASFCAARYAIGVSSGTDALLVALMAIQVGPGDEVITSTYSFFATAGVISRLGARRVFVDIVPETFNVDPSQVAEKITARTKAIMPVVPRFRDRDRLQAYLKDRGIETEVYYPVPLHRQRCFADLTYQEGQLPRAEAAAGESLALPVYPELTEDQQRYVVKQIKQFYAGSVFDQSN